MNARVGRFARAPRSGVVLIVVSWLALAPAAPARAQGAALRRPALHWVRGPGASGCVDPRRLAQRVEELVGPVLVRAPEAEHSIEGYVEARAAREPQDEVRTAPEPQNEARPAREPQNEAHSAGRRVGAGSAREPGGGRPNLRVSVRVVSASGQVLGERVLEQATTTCSALTPAIAFVIAMMIDPGVAAHGLPSELVALLGEGDAPEEKLLDELEQAPPVPAVHPPHAPVALRPDPPPRAEPRFQAATLVRAAYREAPRILLSGEARLLYVLRAPLALAGYLRAGTQAGEHHAGTAASVRVSAYDLGVTACAGQSAGPTVRLHGCAGIELTGASAKGHGFRDDERTFLVAAGLVGQFTARVRIHGAWGIAAVLSGRYLMNTRHFDAVKSDGTHTMLFRLPNTTLGIALGPSYEF